MKVRKEMDYPYPWIIIIFSRIIDVLHRIKYFLNYHFMFYLLLLKLCLSDIHLQSYANSLFDTCAAMTLVRTSAISPHESNIMWCDHNDLIVEIVMSNWEDPWVTTIGAASKNDDLVVVSIWWSELIFEYHLDDTLPSQFCRIYVWCRLWEHWICCWEGIYAAEPWIRLHTKIFDHLNGVAKCPFRPNDFRTPAA